MVLGCVNVTLKAAGPYFTQQVSRAPIDCQAVSLPPHFHHPQTSPVVRAGSARLVDPLSYDAVAAFMSNFSPLRITGHTIRASSAASATATVFAFGDVEETGGATRRPGF